MRTAVLRIMILCLFSCGRKNDKNIIISYDNEGRVNKITVISSDNNNNVELDISETYQVSNLKLSDRSMNQVQMVSFYNSGSIRNITNNLEIDTALMDNQLYSFDQNLNIIDTASLFAIVKYSNDSTKVLYVSNFKNRIREVCLVDSLNADLLAYLPWKQFIMKAGENCPNINFESQEISAIKVLAYTDTFEKVYSGYFYFLTPNWRQELNFSNAKR